MIATSHALIGAAFAASTSNPALGLGLAFISHPLLDLIPHWDFCYNWRQKTRVKLFIETCLDAGAGIILAYLLFGQKIELWYFLAALFLSEIWDIAEAPYWFLKWNFPPFSTIYGVQHKMQSKADLPWGILTQIVTIAVIIFILQTLT